jgi:hypothetical protein
LIQIKEGFGRGFRNSSGSLEVLAAKRRASSRVTELSGVPFPRKSRNKAAMHLLKS